MGRVFVVLGKFKIRIKDRFCKLICYTRFNPPMKFLIEKNALPINVFLAVPSPFVHDLMNFQFTYEKKLTFDEIDYGCLVSLIPFISFQLLRGCVFL